MKASEDREGKWSHSPKTYTANISTVMTSSSNPSTMLAQANTRAAITEELNKMARRRFQRGSVFERGKREKVWVGRWREDVIDPNGRLRRISRKEVLGTKKDFPTKKLALRELGIRLAPINSTNYRATRIATFAQFEGIWQQSVLPQHKLSTQAVCRSQLKVWLIPYFGDCQIKDINGQAIQMFLHSCTRSSRSCRDLITTLRMIWNSAKAWGYAQHNPFDGLVLPKIVRKQRFFFTVEQIRQILSHAEEPQRTFYWLAAETGLRAGELCGLRLQDLDLPNCTIYVKQSVWRGHIQTPKSTNSTRAFAISPKFAAHLRVFLHTWRPNELGLVFATRTGKPWSPSDLKRSYLHPLLAKLGIRRCGLHAFRHANGSLMDRLNAPLKVRQERLGHAPGSDITMEIYTHTVTEDDRRVAQQIGEVLSIESTFIPPVAGHSVN